MLLRFDARCARLLLAEGQEAADLMPQLGEGAVVDDFVLFVGTATHDYIVIRYRSGRLPVKARGVPDRGSPVPPPAG